MDEGSSVDHRHRRVQVHDSVAAREFDGYHRGGRAGIEEGTGKDLDRHRGGALAHANQHGSGLFVLCGTL